MEFKYPSPRVIGQIEPDRYRPLWNLNREFEKVGRSHGVIDIDHYGI